MEKKKVDITKVSNELTGLQKQVEIVKIGDEELNKEQENAEPIASVGEKESYFFKNNIECYSHKSELESEYNDYTHEIRAVFYSSKTKSCLVLLDQSSKDSPQILGGYLIDFFSKEEIVVFPIWREDLLIVNGGEILTKNPKQDFEKLVKEYSQ